MVDQRISFDMLLNASVLTVFRASAQLTPFLNLNLMTGTSLANSTKGGRKRITARIGANVF